MLASSREGGPDDPRPRSAQTREEARRQAGSSTAEAVADGADLAVELAEAAGSGAIDFALDACSVAVEGAATVAKVSLDVVGGIIGGLVDL